MRQMSFVLAALGLAAATSVAHAQDVATGPCATPDSIAFRGNQRIKDAELRSDVGIAPKTTINTRVLRRAIADLYATNQFESDISTSCETIGGKTTLVFNLDERRILSDVRVTGPEKVSPSPVRARVNLLIGKPI